LPECFYLLLQNRFGFVFVHAYHGGIGKRRLEWLPGTRCFQVSI
jgi:hypothetical protein